MPKRSVEPRRCESSPLLVTLIAAASLAGCRGARHAAPGNTVRQTWTQEGAIIQIG